MKDILQDIISHTLDLGDIDLVKITGTETSSTINAVAGDKSVIVVGKVKNPHPEFLGVFGMPNLSKLKTILSLDDYDETSKISMTYKGQTDADKVPEAIHFETKGSDFINDYRLMAKSLIEDRVKDFMFNGNGWNIEFVPSVASTLRLKKQSQVHSEETVFNTKVENGNLNIYFGDPSTHNGNFVFQSGVKGTIKSNWYWPVKEVINILSLPGDKVFRICDQGALMITVDSGLATYEYFFPAHQK
jgi:hypothetical protein|tara:strand:+ start:5016 stop:5750 length:735 start_codon:yes stop_codon:yes gene_type:complete